MKSEETREIDQKPERSGLYGNDSEIEEHIKRSSYGAVRFVDNRFIKNILAQYGRFPFLRVLDIGTGLGWIPTRLDLARPTWSVTGLEASELMLSKARAYAKSFNAKVDWVYSSVEKTPFHSNYFDLIISYFSFNDFPNGKATVKEMERLLKPGGSLIIQDLKRPMQWQMPFLILWRYLTNPLSQFNHEYVECLRGAYTVDELEHILSVTNLVFQTQTFLDSFGGIIRTTAMKTPGKQVGLR